MKQEKSFAQKYALLAAYVLVGTCALAFTLFQFGVVSAQTLNLLAADDAPAPMVIEADNTGNVVLRGEVTSVNENNLTVESWGGEWTIETNSSSSVIPEDGNKGSMTAISVGDFVGVEGVFSTTQDMTINASLVRDWTTNPWEESAVGINLSLDAAVENDTITYSGQVDETDDAASSFTFTDDLNSTYTVHVGNDVGVVNGNNEIRVFSDIDVGDSVELDGVAVGEFITTAMVHITSD